MYLENRIPSATADNFHVLPTLYNDLLDLPTYLYLPISTYLPTYLHL
jgi:hypothetical protein